MIDVDVLCVGETMVMVTPTAGGRLDTESSLVLRPGGAESNVAMYLAQLGHRVAWASRLGDDPFGALVLAEVAKAGVDTTMVEVCADRPTGVYFKDPRPDATEVFYYRRGSAAAGMDRTFAERLAAVRPRLLHVSGITAALSPGCRDLLHELMDDHAGTAVSFDVNYRPSLWPSPPGEQMRELAGSGDVVFVGLDEARVLWGCESAEDVREVLDTPGTLVVKDGGGDATAFHVTGVDRVPALPVEVVEPVGAGDAFAAGWLSGMLRGQDHPTRLRIGHLVAGAALRSVGDHDALPDDEELRRLVLPDPGS